MLNRMLQSLVMAAALLVTGSAAPPCPGVRDGVPPWLDDPAGWEGFVEADEEFAQRTAAVHVQRWRQYRQLEVTPVSDEAAFRTELLAALQQRALFFPEVPAAGTEQREPAATTRPSEPHGPMTEPLFESLAEAVSDALLVLADRPFEEQRHRYFRGRVAGVVEADLPVIEEKLGERVDAALVTEAEAWELLRRLYEGRRAAFGGDFNLRSAAIGSERGLGCQVFFCSPGHTYDDGLLLANGDAAGTGWDDYWRAGMIVCARQFTHPPIAAGRLIERDGRVLRADVQVIVELNNGERAPILLSLFHEPEQGRWWVSSACFSSSPYIAVVGQVR